MKELILKEATSDNLLRKASYIDVVVKKGNIPLFSWLDINITELCNRKCVFCPRSDDKVYPNLNLHMDIDLAKKIGDELARLDYKGVVVFSGYSEPTLCPHFEDIIRAFPSSVRLEVVTNGDKLTSNDFARFHKAGIDHFVVSMYDGEHQVLKFKEICKKANLTSEEFTLRDRWYNANEQYGLKLTNRAGTIDVGDQPDIDLTKPCYYPSYSMTLDWNGDVLVCMQDWNKKVKFGNVASQSLMEIWQSKLLSKYRKKLISGDRNMNPCNGCNADGTLHGYNQAAAWLDKGNNSVAAKVRLD